MVERLRFDDDEKATVKKPTEWIIFYEDGSTFSSDDGGPGDAPVDGVLIVAFSNINAGKVLLHSADYYAWHYVEETRGEWVPHGQRGLDYYLSKENEPGIYVSGYAVPNVQWQRICQQALNDTRLPDKSGWSAHEPDGYAPAAERAEFEASWPKSKA
jgi:hypothetical protein